MNCALDIDGEVRVMMCSGTGFPGVSQEVQIVVGSPNGLPTHCTEFVSGMHCRGTGFGRDVAIDTLSTPPSTRKLYWARNRQSVEFGFWSFLTKGSHHIQIVQFFLTLSAQTSVVTKFDKIMRKTDGC